jgi:hypothetical protein
MAQCTLHKHEFPIDRSKARQLQVAVNQGHQPWRLDSRAVAGSVINQLRNATGDVYHVPFIVLSTTMKRTVLISYNGDNHISYRVTLRKFQWLLPLAINWQSMIWIPTDAAVRRCPAQ